MTTSAEQQPKVTKSDAEWRVQLPPVGFAGLRQAGSERVLTRENVDSRSAGTYTRRASGADL